MTAVKKQGLVASLFGALVPLRARGQMISRMATVARERLPEDAEASASYVGGLHSEYGFEACNTQEVLLADCTVRLLVKKMEDTIAGVCPEGIDDIEYLFNDERFASFFYEAVLASMRRGNIVYLPLVEHEYEANILRTAFEQATFRIKKEKHENIPTFPFFRIRYVGIPEQE